MLIMQGLNGLGAGSDANVQQLQAALVKLGYKNVPTTGMMNDPTVSALWDAIGKDLTKVQNFAASIPSVPGAGKASEVVSWFATSMHWIDDQVKKIPGGFITTHGILAHWVDINATLSTACNLADNATCQTVAKQIVDARQTAFNGIAKGASVFTKVITFLGGGSSATTGPDGMPAGLTPKQQLLWRTQNQMKPPTPGGGQLTPKTPPIDPNQNQPTIQVLGVAVPKWSLWLLGAGALLGGVLVVRHMRAPKAA